MSNQPRNMEVVGRLRQTQLGFAERNRGDASDIDGQASRPRERVRMSQTPYNYSAFVIPSAYGSHTSSFAIIAPAVWSLPSQPAA
jgi:hypothetical protein